MKTTEHVVTDRVYQSEILAEVCTITPSLAPVIAWADSHPAVWGIVTGRRSKAFGLGSCVYIGWSQRSMAPEAVLERVRQMHELVECQQPYATPDSILNTKQKGTVHEQPSILEQNEVREGRRCWLGMARRRQLLPQLYRLLQ